MPLKQHPFMMGVFNLPTVKFNGIWFERLAAW